ncbi:hypothetical protein MUG87_03980 [Ectobacillus sp. JY-23]|uniref:RHS repeat domain-containing protein n=1 Tax=Ectobacillus sp. JY-23 TaxID=2933872 RepID=UPI001FF4B077|nr:RHS repeat-associated core domain-containing protein [Ectobacillus sp. JY-23]UOY93295.1 hypothetical protein MUG87_03980 [Ectobacillus sp. JY-23]
MTKVTGPDNKVITFTYQGEELISSTTPRGKTYRYGYENGLLRYVYDPKHTTQVPYQTTYTYTGNKLTEVKDPLGKVTSIQYDDTKREVTVTDPKGTQDKYGYNIAGNPTYDIIDAGRLNLTTTYEYEANLLKKTVYPNDQGQRLSESYTYDGQGNVTTATDAIGTERYNYNENHDVTKVTDAENKTTTVTYEGSNAVSETQEQANTASVTQYDSYGNPIAESQELAPGANLLSNASFEEAPNNGIPGWIGELVNNHGDNTTYSLSSIIRSPELGGGKQALQLGVKPTADGWGTAQATQIVPAKANTTYTLSSLIQTQNVTDAQAFLEVALLNAQGQATHIKARHNELTGTQNWKKRQLSFKTLPDTTQVKVYMVLSHNSINSKGLAWFDTVQLEEGPVSSSFNPVSNSSFEQIGNGPTGWFWSPALTGEVSDAFQGDNGIVIRRNSVTDPEQQYHQRVSINQTSAIPLTVTAMSKAQNAKTTSGAKTNREYGLWIYANYTDGTYDPFYMEFPLGTQEWNRQALTIPAKKPVKDIDIYPLFRGPNTGTVWYDDIRILEGNVLTKQEYSDNDFPTASYDEEGRKTTFTYDTYGNQTSVTDPKNQKKTLEYNVDNQLTKTTLPNGTVVSYDYDDNGNTTKKTITAGSKTQVVQYDYDVDNKNTVFIDALNRRIQHTYDANSNLVKTEMPNGSVLEWTYDTANRVTELRRNQNLAFSYVYDKNGNETKITDAVNGITRDKAYDTGNRITSMTDRGGSVSWTYHTGSYKLKDLKLQHGATSNTTSYEYNSLNQNTKVTDQGQTYFFDFDEFGNVASYLAGNRAGTSFQYDATQKVTDLHIADKDGKVIASETYEYDENGNRTSINRITGLMVGKTTYTYDNVNQLTKEALPDGTINEFTYDGFSNRTSVKQTKNGTTTTKTATFNSGNQLTNFGNEILTYDANGNRTADGEFTYTWNAADELIAVTKKGASTPFATYKYDDDGRRIEKTVNGITTRYHYDGDSIHVLYETNTSGAVLRQYVYNANGVRLAMKTQGQTFYYHYNPHGDVIAMTDSTGKVVAQYTYDAWGNVLTSSAEGLAADNPFGYAGYMYDKEIGMYYLMARYYHPVHGVFISVDPDPGDADDPITQNGYTYANNNPVKYIDPDGEKHRRADELADLSYAILKAYLKEKERRKQAKSKSKKKKSSIHNNSHSTPTPARGYTLRDIKTHKIQKYGETTRGRARYSKKFYKQENVYMQFEVSGTKKEMHQWQHKKIVAYKKRYGQRPRLNKSDY